MTLHTGVSDRAHACRRRVLFPEPATALTVAFAVSFACGCLYPWNAKFGLFQEKMKVKYPMHYVPEVLMVALLGAGFVANRAE